MTYENSSKEIMKDNKYKLISTEEMDLKEKKEESDKDVILFPFLKVLYLGISLIQQWRRHKITKLCQDE